MTPFCDLITRRETFGTADPGVRIDVDLVNFGVERDGTTLPFEGGEFSICEFEVMAECGDAAEVERAKRRIEAVRNGMGLGHRPERRSKVIEFLDRYSPDHYAAIVEARRGGGPEKASRKRTGPGSDEKDVPGTRIRRAELVKALERKRRMYVPQRIEAERRDVLGGGKCCFDAFAGVWNDPIVTHENVRRVAVAEMLKPENAWLETFWDRQTPDGTGGFHAPGKLWGI